MKTSTRAILAGIALALAAAPLRAADKREAFLAEKKEITLLASERTRQAYADYQRALKMGEDRLRGLHDNYKLSGSTPPTALDGDVQELRMATQRIRLIRGRGRNLPADPEAEKLIQKYWDAYQAGYDKLQKDALISRRIGTPESQTYWEVMKRFGELRGAALSRLIYNSPPGLPALEDVLAKDEWRLLKDVENPSVKTRGKVNCVIAPGEHPRSVTVEAGPFYSSQGLLPTSAPLSSGAFFVPVGCRTVTKRESGVKVILRVSRGDGLVYIGSSEQELQYGYLSIPPDTGYYIENIGEEPLDLEYVTLPAS